MATRPILGNGGSVVAATMLVALLACTSVSAPMRVGDASRPSDGKVAPDASSVTASPDGPSPALADAPPEARASDRSSCGDTEADPRNCGACGHDCLAGATCRTGQCQPVVMLETTAVCPVPFGLDGGFLYFTQYTATLADALRISKDAVRGAPDAIVTGLTGSVFIGAMGGRLFWNERSAVDGTEHGTSCELANCSGTVSHPFAPNGQLVQFNGALAQSVAVVDTTAPAGTLQLAWHTVVGTDVVQTAEFSGSASAGSPYGFFTNGDVVCWNSWPADTATESAAGSLYGKGPSAETQRPAKLASGFAFSTFIIDVNQRSVLLIDISAGGLYRVPLPLGLGVKPPQLLTANSKGMRIAAATEDDKGVYWVDGDGTMYRCAPDDCYASQTVLAIGQVPNASRLLQDETALYWGTTSPCQLMRLAK